MSNHTPLQIGDSEIKFVTEYDDIPGGPRRLYVYAFAGGVRTYVRFEGPMIIITPVEPGVEILPALSWAPKFDTIVEGLTAVLHDALLELTGGDQVPPPA